LGSSRLQRRAPGSLMLEASSLLRGNRRSLEKAPCLISDSEMLEKIEPNIVRMTDTRLGRMLLEGIHRYTLHMVYIQHKNPRKILFNCHTHQTVSCTPITPCSSLTSHETVQLPAPQLFWVKAFSMKPCLPVMGCCCFLSHCWSAAPFRVKRSGLQCCEEPQGTFGLLGAGLPDPILWAFRGKNIPLSLCACE